jgi:hypothetical protein
MLFAVSDIVWQAVIGAVVTIVLAWMQRQTQIAVAQTGKKTQETVTETATAAAEKVAEVKVHLETVTAKNEEKAAVVEQKIDEIAKVGKISHDLANSAMASQKRMMADVSKAKADESGSPTDRALADAAETAYQAHIAGQEASDAKELAADKLIAAAKLVEQQRVDPPQPMH